MDLGYDSRRCLIVGGSYGIGRAAAELMAAEGADVVIASRSAGNLDDAAAMIKVTTGRRPETVVADITESEAARTLAEAVTRRWGALDVLVTAVGGSIRSAFEDLSDEDWLTNYSFNILSTVRAIRALLPALRQGTAPAVVTLGAAASKMPYAHQIVSNVHKAGILGLTKTLGSELAVEGIRVNCVAPGRTLTPPSARRRSRRSKTGARRASSRIFPTTSRSAASANRERSGSWWSGSPVRLLPMSRVRPSTSMAGSRVGCSEGGQQYE